MDDQGAGQFVDAYERRKLEMDRLKKHEDEIDFFALELKCRRALIGDWKPVSALPLFGFPIPVPQLMVPGIRATARRLDWFGRSFTLPVVIVRARRIALSRPTAGLAYALYHYLGTFGSADDTVGEIAGSVLTYFS